MTLVPVLHHTQQLVELDIIIRRRILYYIQGDRIGPVDLENAMRVGR
jgi:hypothetical protein